MESQLLLLAELSLLAEQLEIKVSQTLTCFASVLPSSELNSPYMSQSIILL